MKVQRHLKSTVSDAHFLEKQWQQRDINKNNLPYETQPEPHYVAPTSSSVSTGLKKNNRTYRVAQEMTTFQHRKLLQCFRLSSQLNL